MKITTVEYAGTVVAHGDPPPGTLPQVAFSGRSNVGKSSLINVLLRRTRSKIARVSATPGKTQALNFYRVNDAFFLVDLPGYGFARVPEAVRSSWARLIEGYLSGSPELRGVVHLVDARHRPTRHDRQMVSYLADLGIPSLIVLNKIDKLTRSERAGAFERASVELELDDTQILPFSSKTGEGREELLGALEMLIEDVGKAGTATRGILDVAPDGDVAGAQGEDVGAGDAAGPDGDEDEEHDHGSRRTS